MTVLFLQVVLTAIYRKNFKPHIFTDINMPGKYFTAYKKWFEYVVEGKVSFLGVFSKWDLKRYPQLKEKNQNTIICMMHWILTKFI